jgi:hypothetical protein
MTYELVTLQFLVDEHFGTFRECVEDHISDFTWPEEILIPYFSAGELSHSSLDWHSLAFWQEWHSED